MRRKTIVYSPIGPEILQIVEQHGNNPEAVLEIFNDCQARYGHLTPESIRDIARALQIPAEKAQGIATFYTMVKTEALPSNTLRICDGPVCWLKGARQLLEKENQNGDRQIERTSCLGLCDHAPAAWINGEQEGFLIPGSLLAQSASRR